MKDLEALAELRREYAALPDEQLIELAQQGKDDYREGAYELIMAEVSRRDLADKVARAPAVESDETGGDESCEGTPCGGSCASKPDDELVPFMIFLGEDDVTSVSMILDGAGITYCSDALHLKGKEYPRLCMVPRGMVAQAIQLCGLMKLKNSIALW